MKKKIAIFGSTGSIGESLINIIKQNSKSFKIVFLDLVDLILKNLFKIIYKQ